MAHVEECARPAIRSLLALQIAEMDLTSVGPVKFPLLGMVAAAGEGRGSQSQ
jgi:hypothetical protein